MSGAVSRAVRFHEYGAPLDVLREEQVEVPDAPPGRVRVRVAAVGLNPADWALTTGFLPTETPTGVGYDVAGTVDSIGEGVSGVQIGDVVFGTAAFREQPSAGLADLAVLDHWFAVPEGLDPAQAAVLTMVVQTASWTLDALEVRAGTTLVVNGAGGMVGFAAVQIARERGARVIATAGSTFTRELERFGATVTPYGAGLVDRVRALAGDGVDLVLDTAPANASPIPDLVELVGDPRSVVTISNQVGARQVGARVNLDLLRGGTPLEPLERLLPRYAARTASGAFRMPIARRFPFGDWRDAVALSTSGAPHGKVVVLPGA